MSPVLLQSIAGEGGRLIVCGIFVSILIRIVAYEKHVPWRNSLKAPGNSFHCHFLMAVGWPVFMKMPGHGPELRQGIQALCQTFGGAADQKYDLSIGGK
jgi:hypothetical protein